MNQTVPASGRAMQNARRDWLKWVGGAALAPAVGAAAAAAPATGARRGASDFPNVLVQTHEGRKVRFYDDLVRGKIVVFNMMYTVCTGICPGGTANLLRVQQALGSRVGKDVFMYSMTLQPQFDDARALREYVHRFGIKPGWTYLTGTPSEMDLLRRKLGFFNSDPAVDSDLNSHTGMVRAGNEALDRWFMVPALGSAEQIVTVIQRL
jgi:protein SCO1/2